MCQRNENVDKKNGVNNEKTCAQHDGKNAERSTVERMIKKKTRSRQGDHEVNEDAQRADWSSSLGLTHCNCSWAA